MRQNRKKAARRLAGGRLQTWQSGDKMEASRGRCEMLKGRVCRPALVESSCPEP